MRYCGLCDEYKSFDNFYISAKNGRYLSYCKECQAAKGKIQYQKSKNTEKVIPEGKQCPDCKNFLLSTAFYSNNARKDGLELRCKKCSHINTIVQQYGLTKEEYAGMARECIVCGRGEEDIQLGIDHCHRTGVVRGLLCINCNSALGMVKDSTDRMRSALAYLTASEDTK